MYARKILISSCNRYGNPSYSILEGLALLQTKKYIMAKDIKSRLAIYKIDKRSATLQKFKD
jgi:hypothetical protein